MANDLLARALKAADMQIEDLAQAVQVDVKTAQRWLSTNRTPYRRHRVRVARALGVSERELWPDLQDPEPEPPSASSPAFDVQPDAPPAASLSRDGLVDWRALLAAASATIDLLDYSLSDILTQPGVVDELIQRAEHGARVRILIAAASCADVYEAELERTLEPGWWADYETAPAPEPVIRRQIDASSRILDQIHGLAGIQVRRFIAHRYNSILRFDDQMLVLIHTWGVDTLNALQLHTWQNADDRGTFERFATHFQAIWEHAMDFDQPFTEEDLDDWERTLDHSSALSDRAYKLKLYQARATYHGALADARREYEHELSQLQTRWRQAHDR